VILFQIASYYPISDNFFNPLIFVVMGSAAEPPETLEAGDVSIRAISADTSHWIINIFVSI